MMLLALAAFFMPRGSVIHAWDSVVFLQHLSRFGELSSADGEQNTVVLLARHCSEANEDVGAPMPSARLVLAPPDDQISIIYDPFDFIALNNPPTPKP